MATHGASSELLTGPTSVMAAVASRRTRALLVSATALFAVAALALRLGEQASRADVLSLVVAVAAAAALFGVSRWPLFVAVGIACLRIIVTVDTGVDVALYPAFAVAAFVAAGTGERRSHLLAVSGVGVVSAVAVGVLDADPFWFEFAGETALNLLPIVMADGVRARAERLRDRIDLEAGRRVQDERLRFARDLHDTVAHGLSTIAVQSGVASHLIDRSPDQAKEALDAINEASRNALGELRAMVGVLRSTDDAPRAPTPTSTDDIVGLVTYAQQNGCTVDFRIAGRPPARAAVTTMVAGHRIMQEALTNVVRHAGPVDVAIAVHHTPAAMKLDIENTAGKASRAGTESTGVGITGMRERALALGGSLHAGPTESGGFLVTATLPYGPGAT